MLFSDISITLPDNKSSLEQANSDLSEYHVEGNETYSETDTTYLDSEESLQRVFLFYISFLLNS